MDTPLKRLLLPFEPGYGHLPVAVLTDNKRVILADEGERFSLYNPDTGVRRPFGALGGYNDGFGYEVCQAANGHVFVVGADHGISITEDLGEGVPFRELASEHFETADPGASFLNGGAISVSTYGDIVAVGGFYMPRVEVLSLDGKLLTTIGPRFAHRGCTYSFLPEDPNSLCAHSWLLGLCVDSQQRIWVAPNPFVICVFARSGECLVVSEPDELVRDERGSLHEGWGVDRNGLLWCHGGNTAFEVAEPSTAWMAPELAGETQRRTGFEPAM